MYIHNIPKVYHTNIYSYLISSNSIIENIPVVISHTLYKYLVKMKDILSKSKIKHIDPYEYIYSEIPLKTNSVCVTDNVSSFYNMIEIYQTFNIVEQLPNTCKSFHFTSDIETCGCMEAMLYCRDNILDQSCITQPDFFDSAKLQECYYMHHGSCHLVTSDFIHEEEIKNTKLLFTQCIYAFACQKKEGNFILKLTEIYTQATIDMLYLLSSLYDTVYIYKPYTISHLQSYRYLICMHFRLEDTKELIDKMCILLNAFTDTTYPDRFLQCDIPYSYICALQDSNAIIGQSQLEYMNLSLKQYQDVSNETNEYRVSNHINKCIQWCKKFKLPRSIY